MPLTRNSPMGLVLVGDSDAHGELWKENPLILRNHPRVHRYEYVLVIDCCTWNCWTKYCDSPVQPLHLQWASSTINIAPDLSCARSELSRVAGSRSGTIKSVR
jgi:hypothetical protein